MYICWEIFRAEQKTSNLHTFTLKSYCLICYIFLRLYWLLYEAFSWKVCFEGFCFYLLPENDQSVIGCANNLLPLMYGQLYTASTLKVYLLKKCLSSFDEMLSNWNCLLLLKNAMKPIICQAEIYWLKEGERHFSRVHYSWISEQACSPLLTWWLGSPPVPPVLFFSIAVMVPGRLSDYSESSCSVSWPLPVSEKHLFLWVNGTWGRGLDQDWQKPSSTIRSVLMT